MVATYAQFSHAHARACAVASCVWSTPSRPTSARRSRGSIARTNCSNSSTSLIDIGRVSQVPVAWVSISARPPPHRVRQRSNAPRAVAKMFRPSLRRSEKHQTEMLETPRKQRTAYARQASGFRWAMSSISTDAPSGNEATPIVVRAGYGCSNMVSYIPFISANVSMLVR